MFAIICNIVWSMVFNVIADYQYSTLSYDIQIFIIIQIILCYFWGLIMDSKGYPIGFSRGVENTIP